MCPDYLAIYQILHKNNYPNAHAVAKTISSLGQPYEDVVEKILAGYPLDYVLGFVDFYNTKISVNASVLIPRPETELLVDLVSSEIEKLNLKKISILDICTGSGCIAISLKKRFPHAQVVALDKSLEALECAKQNAKQNETSVEFYQSDLLSNLPQNKFDFVVCNPPYISIDEYETLDSSVKMHEPKMALTDFGDGLEFYRRLSQDLCSFLNSSAKVFFEIGYNQKESLSKIFNTISWTKCDCRKDYAGHDRFFSLESAH